MCQSEYDHEIFIDNLTLFLLMLSDCTVVDGAEINAVWRYHFYKEVASQKIQNCVSDNELGIQIFKQKNMISQDLYYTNLAKLQASFMP